MEPVAALVAKLLKADGGRLLLADPLERTRHYRRAPSLPSSFWHCLHCFLLVDLF